MRSLEWIKADEAARVRVAKRKPKTKPGRPPHSLSHRFQIRCTVADYARWTLVARSLGLTVSQWARMVMLKAESR